MPQFILMLTRDDRTLPDPVSVCADLAGLDVAQLGFKDVGLDAELLGDLAAAIHGLGAEASIELVGLDEEAEVRWAGRAAEAGIDRVLGGAHAGPVVHELAGSAVQYFPFAGAVGGHPTQLWGTVETIVDSARRLTDLGVDGVDLLAYRFNGDAPALTEAVVRATGLPIVAAGGIHSDEQISALARAGVWGFTMGTAMFDGSYRPEARSLRQRVTSALQVAREGAGEALC